MSLGPNLSFSVVKRETREFDEVQSFLDRKGWKRTGTLGSKVAYYQNAGVNLTVVDGPRAVLIFPSGPLRGRLFSENIGFGFLSEDSGLGMGVKQDSQPQSQSRSVDNGVNEMNL